MKIAIYGAGGIIGQTMRLYQPPGHEIRYYRRHADPLHHGCDLTQESEALQVFRPDVIVNLAGENRPDVVERSPSAYRRINVTVPYGLAQWCDREGSHYIHISSQAVFSGDDPPYGSDSPLKPINAYGRQKAEAEQLVRQCENWTIIRPTFVLGIRPLPHVGRQNPLEQILGSPRGKQVDDRWFSPVFARELAQILWEYVERGPETRGQIIHVGRPVRMSRYGVAVEAGCDPTPVSHDEFDCAAERPVDTTYAEGAQYRVGESRHDEMAFCREEDDVPWCKRVQVVRELALFFGIQEGDASQYLDRGFGALHGDVAVSFNRANPQSDAELLAWYRETVSYIWELTAYHLDPGFNYTGMCQGIVDRLKGTKGEVLVVADGVGDVTVALREARVKAVYHDLAGSRTAAFAEFKLWRRYGRVGETELTDGWEPNLSFGRYAAVICLDFLEHVTDVPAWTRAIHDSLMPGGVAFFQNAFGIGSNTNGGSIPMHLTTNDRYAKDWPPLMSGVGFRQEGAGNWWGRAA
jgi:dTDP-4-dehydrorhamnose reductase